MFLTTVQRKRNTRRGNWSRNPLKSGQGFLLVNEGWLNGKGCQVAIPSNRVKVSYFKKEANKHRLFLNSVAIPSNRVKVSYCPSCGAFIMSDGRITGSQSPQIGSRFLTRFWAYRRYAISHFWWVAIPSNRVKVSYCTHLFLRIIGNLTPLLREPHYFYAFFFPI